jgi:predicted MFS family arabinose efflux permease
MLSNCSVPMWFSWMGELLPHGKINEFWAERRRWAALTTAACMLLSAEFFRRMGNLDIRLTYSAIATLGTLAGILDILLFIKVPEPPSAVTAEPLHLRFLIEPFKDPNFRGMLAYSGFFTFAIMFAAPFFQLYVLKELLLPVDVVLMLWFCHAVGGMIFSRHIGRLADRVGQRPVIILCTALKSLIVLGFFLIRPGPWMLMLIPIFLFDNMLNTGLLVARNGYMLKQSPPEHRPMYVAAVLAGSGLCGASASLLAGQLFRSMEGFRTEWWGFSLTPYHVVFGISFLLRSCSVFTALWIREPSGRATAEVLFEHIVPAFLRWLSFPLGFFNRRDP